MAVAEIQARIASIQAQFGVVSQMAVASAPSSATVDHSFESMLGEVHNHADASDSADWAAKLPAAARPWMSEIQAAAKAAGVDPKLVAAVAWTESGFNPNAGSPAGAIGLMQLMPGTARGLGVNPRDPVQNLQGGAQYLARQIKSFGRVDLALAAYNAGPGAVQRHGGIPPYRETQGYVTKVLDRLRTL